MEPGMRRFWIEFAPDDLTQWASFPGIGVTAENEEEALNLAQKEVFRDWPMPPVRRMVADVDISTLDEEVVLNMGVPIWRGIWFPRGYERWKDD